MPQSTLAPRIGEILVAHGACTLQRVEEALEDQVVYDGRLGTNLLELGAITERQLARALAQQKGLPAAWGDIAVQPGALALVPRDAALRYQVVPLRLERQRLDVLVNEVTDVGRLDELAFAVGKEIRPVLVTEARLWHLLHRYYGIPSPRRRAHAGSRTPVPGARSPGAASPTPRPDAERPDFGGALASNQELLAELQNAAGRRFLTRPPASAPVPAAAAGATPTRPVERAAPVQPPLPPRAPRPAPEAAFVSDQTVLAELQDDASRRFRPQLPPPLPRRPAAAAPPGAPPPGWPSQR